MNIAKVVKIYFENQNFACEVSDLKIIENCWGY